MEDDGNNEINYQVADSYKQNSFTFSCGTTTSYANPRAIMADAISSGLQPHDPITIGGNGQFTSSNGVTGGSGTASDPYIISGWDISSGGIIIFNTRAFFVIRHVYIHSVRGLGVSLSNVANGRVEDSAVSGNGSGLKVDGSSNVTIVDNNFSNSWDVGDGMGLDIEGSTNILASGNVVSSNIQTGIYVNWRKVSVENNLVSSNGYGGIEVVGGSMIDISANNLSNNTGWGIVAVGLNSSVINRNTVERTRPICSNCWGGIGIELLQSTGVSVFHNNLVGNPVQACDNQNQMKVCSDTSISPNRWDDGYPSGGNFWSNYNGTDTCSGPQQNICGYPDGVGDTPMMFSYARDRYPLMKPFTTNPPVVSSVSPSSGHPNTQIIVAGQGLARSTSVSVCRVPERFIVLSDNTLLTVASSGHSKLPQA